MPIFTQRPIPAAQLARIWKVTDTADNLVYYINFAQVAAVAYNTSTQGMTIRLPFDSPGSGNQTTPATIEVNAEEVPELLAYLESAWDVEIAGNTPP